MNVKVVLSIIICLLLNTAHASDQIKLPHPNKEQLKKILADFEGYADKAMKEWRVPGMAIAIVTDDDLIYSKGFGVKEQGKPDPVDTRTIFQVGSTSKAFTSTLVAIMVDKGKLKWKDKVIDHLPDFKMYDPWVTSQFEVEDLLAQRSGLKTQALSGLAFLGFDRKYTMDALRYVKPVYSFRSQFSYINITFLWAAALVEKYTKMSWEKDLEKYIFRPLGMKNSSSTLQDYLKAKNAAALHMSRTNTMDGEIVTIPKDSPFFDWVYPMGPAGSIGSNVIDMSKWLRMHIAEGKFEGKRIVSRKNLNYTHAPHTIADAPVEGEQLYYGLSWVYNTYRPYSIVWHNGGTSGAKSIVSFMPEGNIGIVVLTNLDGNMVPEALAKKFYDLYFNNPAKDWSKELLDKARSDEKKNPRPKPPAHPNPHAPLENYVGKYNNSAYGDLQIKVDNNELFAILGPKQIKFLLKHWDKNTFVASIPGYVDWFELVVFNMDPDGKASSVTLNMYDEVDAGLFKKI